MHEPVDKNLKHKTDVLDWAEIDWTGCEMNFRAPDTEDLTMSPVRAYGALAAACGIAMGVAMLLLVLVAPLVIESGPLVTTSVVVVVAVLIGVGKYRPVPTSMPDQGSLMVSLAGAASVVAFFLTLEHMHSQSVFHVGVVLHLAVGVPGCLYVADQVTGHMLHWQSADPGLDRDEMVVWRNAWCGRFVTEHVHELVKTGVPARTLVRLQRYWRGHLAVGASAIASLLGGLIAAQAAEIEHVGISIGLMWTATLAALAAVTYGRHAGAYCVWSRSLGHWFDYQKDHPQPPWVVLSPAGRPVVRAFRTFSTAGLAGLGMLLLGLSDFHWGARAIQDLSFGPFWEVAAAWAGATLLVPLNVLLICFIVSAPTVAVFHQAIEELTEEPVDDDDEDQVDADEHEQAPAAVAV